MPLTTLPSDNFNTLLLSECSTINTVELATLLKKHHAIIAGGAILGSLSGSLELHDLDIYVNLKNAQNFIHELYSSTLRPRSYPAKHTAPPYDSSFLIKNNILARYHLMLRIAILCDIMIVSDDVTVESVVENFDLSFCKTWYDGSNILTNHYEDIISKKGTLGKDYLETYLKGNTFTVKRIKKYTRRGYTITLPSVDTNKIVMQKFHKQVIKPEMWVIYKILELLLLLERLTSGEFYSDNYFCFMTYCLQKLYEYKLNHRKSSIYNIDGLKFLMNILYNSKTTDFWTIDMLIYVLICAKKITIQYRDFWGNMLDRDMVTGMCKWLPLLELDYSSYFQSIGIQLTSTDTEPAHGFNKLDIPLCEGEVPPFSAGKNGFSENATIQELENRVKDGTRILLLNDDERKELYYTAYPNFRPLSALERMVQQQEQIRAAAARFAEQYPQEQEQEEDTEPYNLPNSDIQVPGRCFSITNAKDINTSSWYSKEGSILFLVEFYPGADPDLVCTNTEVLENSLSNEPGINYRCGSRRGFIAGTETEVDLDNLPDGVAVDVAMTDIDYSVEYIPFSYGVDGTTVMNAYLPRNQVERILTNIETGSQIRLFTLEFSDTIAHTVSKNNTQRGTVPADFVSTNHCQAGSAIIVFRVKEFTQAQERSPPALERPRQVQNTVRRLWNGDSPPSNPFEDDPHDQGTPRRLFD